MSLLDNIKPAPNPDTYVLNLFKILYGNTQLPQNTQQTQLPQYNNNLLQQINPYYTLQKPYDSLSPMKMYQQFKQTGVIPPENTSSFTPYIPPQINYQQTAPLVPSITPETSVASGGK